MDGVLVVIFIVASIALVVANVIEYFEYKRYRKAVNSVIAFGESMQVSFNEVAEHMNRFQQQVIVMAQGVGSQEQDINYIKSVLEIHSEALSVAHPKQVDVVKDYLGIDTNGADTVRTI